MVVRTRKGLGTRRHNTTTSQIASGTKTSNPATTLPSGTMPKSWSGTRIAAIAASRPMADADSPSLRCTVVSPISDSFHACLCTGGPGRQASSERGIEGEEISPRTALHRPPNRPEAPSNYVVEGLRPGGELEEVQLPRPGDGLRAVARSQLAVDVFEVGLDGAQDYEQFAGDLRVTLAGSDEDEHLQLAFAQRLRQLRSRPHGLRGVLFD